MLPIKKLAYVDALRGIAILLVILVHSSQRIGELGVWPERMAGLGQFGVQLFFCASAYTLTRSWMRRAPSAHRFSDFYVRRFFRISPLYYVAIAMYFCSATIMGNNSSYDLLNVAANVLFVHGLVPSANNVIVPGGWSIGTEMLFYLLFPFLITVLLRRSRNPAITLGVLFCGAVLVYSLVAHFLKVAGFNIGNNGFYYFCLLVQFPVFLLGILAYFVAMSIPSESFSIRIIALAGVIVFALATALLFWHGTDAATLTAVGTSGVASFFLLVTLRSCSYLPHWICKVGQVSYSMYVSHFFFAWFLADAIQSWILPLRSFVRLGIIFLVASVCSYIVALVTERLIERRGIRAGERLIERRAELA